MQHNILPSDLKQAEQFLLNSLLSINNSSPSSRISVDIRFEGLRLSPIIFRLSRALKENEIDNCMVWPDAGATALAKRDANDLESSIFSLKEVINDPSTISDSCYLIVISPQPYDFDLFEKLCLSTNSIIIMVNGKLQDFALGVGSVGRERLKGFSSSWFPAFWLQALDKGALMRIHPDDWHLFKAFPEGYRLKNTYSSKPDPETIFMQLSSSN